MTKKLLSVFLLTTSFAYASEPEIFKYEEEIAIPTKCYPTSMLKQHFGFSEIVMTSHDTTRPFDLLNDHLLYVPSKSAMFLIRENTELSYTCVITVFDKKDNTAK